VKGHGWWLYSNLTEGLGLSLTARRGIGTSHFRITGALCLDKKVWHAVREEKELWTRHLAWPPRHLAWFRTISWVSMF
jgi:hypothetical protein